MIVYRSQRPRRHPAGRGAPPGPASRENEFELPLEPFNDGGWYWFDLVAGDEDLVLLEAGLAGARRATPRLGTVTLGMTTFNRPDYAVANVRTLAASDDLRPILHQMLVVDQGTKLVTDEPDFAEAEAEMGGRLRIIRQGNMGGSGGYARGMYEVANGRADGSKSDYFMTLDDDIRIEPESILRAVTFADYCRTPTIVGAHMFDLYNRTAAQRLRRGRRPVQFRWGPIEGLGARSTSPRAACARTPTCTGAGTPTTTAGGCA